MHCLIIGEKEKPETVNQKNTKGNNDDVIVIEKDLQLSCAHF